MNSEDKDHMMLFSARYLFVVGLLLCMTLVPAGIVLADPGTDDPAASAGLQVQNLQQQAATIQAQVAGLDHDLELVVEQHNASLVSVGQLTMKLADSRAQLDDARARHDAVENQMSDRLSAMYKAGDINVMSILLNSSSISDFYEQARYMAKIHEQDQKLEQQLLASTALIQSLTDDIDHDRTEQMRLEQEQRDQEQIITAKIAERQAALSNVNSQVQQIIQQEEARKQAEQARLAAEYAATIGDLQISDQLQARVVQTGMQYLGVPYVWGGESPRGFDCSGLTKYIYAQFGVNLPHNAAMQFQLGAPVPKELLQPGDLVFWGPGNPHHVGMYIGKGKFIEAPDFGEVVKISQLTFDSDYAGARRYPLKTPGTAAQQ